MKPYRRRARDWKSPVCLVAVIIAAPTIAAETPSIDVSKGWTPAVAEAGGDRPLYMTITSHADTPDSLLRARCPTAIADFTEKHATDRGEGGFSMREVKNFTIPAGATVALEPEGNHLMLLHLRAPLQEGQTFSCAVVFQKAGSIPVEIKVAPSGAKSPS